MTRRCAFCSGFKSHRCFFPVVRNPTLKIHAQNQKRSNSFTLPSSSPPLGSPHLSPHKMAREVRNTTSDTELSLSFEARRLSPVTSDVGKEGIANPYARSHAHTDAAFKRYTSPLTIPISPTHSPHLAVSFPFPLSVRSFPSSLGTTPQTPPLLSPFRSESERSVRSGERAGSHWPVGERDVTERARIKTGMEGPTWLQRVDCSTDSGVTGSRQFSLPHSHARGTRTSWSPAWCANSELLITPGKSPEVKAGEVRRSSQPSRQRKIPLFSFFATRRTA